MLRRFFATDASTTLLFQRIVLGLVMFPHGAQKMLGWFGGGGWDKTMAMMSQGGLPKPLVALVILGEFFGALGLIVGLGTRLAAFGIASIMIGAIATVHAKVGFFMNWMGNQPGEGFEYHLLALALELPLILRGAGAFSLDRGIARGLERRGPAGAPAHGVPR